MHLLDSDVTVRGTTHLTSNSAYFGGESNYLDMHTH